ncbi:MAG: amidohydrolase family protein [Clostridiales bacterium]|nr:amidohydrolase family protein [Clostridiales bacterium]
MTTLLRQAMLYDGTGEKPYIGDVLIQGERIARVAPSIDAEAERVIDLRGKSVAPGFIDVHSHNDWFAVRENNLPYFEPFIRQGITSFVTGNCGLSAIAFEKDTPHLDKIGGGLFGYRGQTRGVYPDAQAFLSAVDHRTPCNVAVLAGHCSARASVAGNANRRLTPEEEARMLAILEESLRQGAAGVSLGLMYNPGIFAGEEELKKVAALCLKYDKPLTVHPRAESKVSMAYPQLLGRSHLLRAMDEMARVAGRTKLKLQCSHLIFVGRNTFADKDEAVAIINRMRAAGVQAQFDIYNEKKGVSVITVILPAWYQGMSEAERARPLTRLRLRLLVRASIMLLGFGFGDIEVAYIGPGFEQYEGKTVRQLARERGVSDLKMYLQLCRESGFNGRVNMGPYTTDEIIHDFEKNPLCLYMTDAWVEDHGVQNPAIYDCFPKFLRDAALGLGDSLPATVRRMTGASADRFMLRDRGYLRAGCYADMTVFDEAALRAATPDQAKSFGIEKVFVNGRLLLDGDALDSAAAAHSGMAMPV